MSLAADILDRIVAGRVIASAQLVAQWDTDVVSGEGPLQSLGDELASQLRNDYTESEGDLFGPAGLILRAPEINAQLSPMGISLQREFNGAYTQQWDLAARHVEKTWLPILELPAKHGVPIAELGLVMIFRMSTEGFEGVDPHEFVTRLVRSPRPPGLIDAEVRMVFAREERYLLNIGIGSYVRLEHAPISPSSPPILKAMRAMISDQGIQIRLDVNTMFPFLFKGRVRSVAPEELKKLVELAGNVVEKDFRSIMEVARE